MVTLVKSFLCTALIVATAAQAADGRVVELEGVCSSPLYESLAVLNKEAAASVEGPTDTDALAELSAWANVRQRRVNETAAGIQRSVRAFRVEHEKKDSTVGSSAIAEEQDQKINALFYEIGLELEAISNHQ